MLILFFIQDASPIRNKSIRVNPQSRPRTVQLKNISFKIKNTNSNIIKDQVKQPIVNDKTRCAILISTNGKQTKKKK